MIKNAMIWTGALALAMGMATQGRADDGAAKAKLEKARTMLAARSTTDQAPTIALVEEALKDTQNPDLTYDLLIVGSRAALWAGKHVDDRDTKITYFEKGMSFADQAKKVDDSYSTAYVWYAYNLGDWGEARGILTSLGRKDELQQNLEAALDRITRDGQPGETDDGYGADRILGRMYFRLPFFAGGSRDKALQHLAKAYQNGKGNALNYVYYAETLADGNDDDRAKARAVLDELLSKDAHNMDADRLPENLEDMESARQLRKDLGN